MNTLVIELPKTSIDFLGEKSESCRMKIFVDFENHDMFTSIMESISATNGSNTFLNNLFTKYLPNKDTKIIRVEELDENKNVIKIITTEKNKENE